MFEKQNLTRMMFITLAIAVLLAGTLLLLNPRPVAADSPVTYSYDNAGRLVKADYGALFIVYTYDAAGNLLSREIKIEGKIYLPLVLRDYGT